MTEGSGRGQFKCSGTLFIYAVCRILRSILLGLLKGVKIRKWNLQTETKKPPWP
jgi:hypothetical protein